MSGIDSKWSEACIVLQWCIFIYFVLCLAPFEAVQLLYFSTESDFK